MQIVNTLWRVPVAGASCSWGSRRLSTPTPVAAIRITYARLGDGAGGLAVVGATLDGGR